MRITRALTIFLLFVGVVSINGQLQFRRKHLRNPGETISLVQVSHKNSLNPNEIAENMKQIEEQKSKIYEEMGKASKSIKDTESKMDVMKKEAVENVRQNRERKKVNADKMKAYLDSNAIAAKRRQLQIVSCLQMIKGGANRLYWSLRKMFAELPDEKVCPVFKGMKFPSMSKHGHTERFYKKYKLGESPVNDGTEVLYFDAVKLNLWRCMCTEREIKAKYPVGKPAASLMLQKTAEKIEERAESLEKKVGSIRPQIEASAKKEEKEEQNDVANGVVSN
jgi:hypothetical protein